MIDFMPDFTLETELGCRVAGVDEVGRGPWAGPVVAAAVILDAARIPEGLNDSKKLSKARREALFPILFDCTVIGIGQASVEEIDEINILQASFLAMQRAIDALPTTPQHLLIDGNRLPKNLPCPATAVIKGDGKCLSIAAASIVAKVTRDQIMADLAENFPDYGWARNAGYGTAQHRQALDLVGVSPHHRKSFAPIHRLMTQESVATD
ncbi:MAG: ribonuclease HII [Alphaproteobacteria bacterium]